MSRVKGGLSSGRVFSLVLVIFVIAILYLAKELLVPFALAVLLSFVLAPICQRLERLHVPRALSVTLVVLLTLFVVGAIGYVVAGQMLQLAEDLPKYRDKIQAKVSSINSPENTTIGRFRKLYNEITNIAEPAAKPVADAPNQNAYINNQKSPATDGSKEDEPVAVAVVAEPTGPWSYASAILAPTFGALATVGVVLLFTFFMLLEREDLRNRFFRLAGTGQLSVTTQAVDEAAHRVSRYLLMQLIVNATYGIAVGIGLYFIDVPNAILWGVLAGLLRYIPYIGPWIAAAFPIALTVITTDGWWPTLSTCALFVVLELLSNNLMEPVLYRSSTGVSTIGIIVSAVFWTWLWGSIGLVLATPLTVCISVIGRYVPQLWFLNVLLTDEPPLEPGSHYYQRLLADDGEEAAEVLEEFGKTHSLEEVYDSILLPALEQIEKDGHHGAWEDGRQAYLREFIREAVEELGEKEASRQQQPAETTTETENATASAPARLVTRRCIACLPARDDADEIAALMLSQVLESKGHCTQHFSVKSLAGEMLDQIEEKNVDLAIVSAVPPFGGTHTRYLCKRLHSRFPDLKLAVGLWQTTPVSAKTNGRLATACADKVVTTLAEAVAAVS